jgi:hypothetical protein
LGGPQSQSGRRGEEKILDPSGIRTPTPRDLEALKYFLVVNGHEYEKYDTYFRIATSNVLQIVTHQTWSNDRPGSNLSRE